MGVLLQADGQRWWAGISIAIAGNVLISLALNLQKLAHLRIQQRVDEEVRLREHQRSGDESSSERTASRSMSCSSDGRYRSKSADPAKVSHAPKTQ